MIPASKEQVKGWTSVIVQIHDDVIELAGGLKGVRDIGGLEHAVSIILPIKLV